MVRNLTRTKAASWVKALEPDREVCLWVAVDASDMYALAVREYGGGGGGADVRKGLTVPAKRRRGCPRDG